MEVKHTVAALRGKWMQKGTGQAEAQVAWRADGPNRVVDYVVDSEEKWTDLFRPTVAVGTRQMDAVEYMISKGVWLKVGAHRFSPQRLQTFNALFVAKYEASLSQGMTASQFFALPQLQTVASAARYIGYEP